MEKGGNKNLSNPANGGDNFFFFPLSKLVSFARYSAYFFLSLVLLLPIIPDTGKLFFPIGRDLIFKVLTEILFLTSAAFFILKKKYSGNKNLSPRSFIGENCLKFGIAASVFSLWVFYSLSTLFSLQPSFSFWGNIYKNMGWLTFSHLVLFFISILVLLENGSWKTIIKFTSFPAIIVSIVAIFQSANGISRPPSTLANPDYLSAYLILLAPIYFYFSNFFAKLNKKNLKNNFPFSKKWQKFFSFAFSLILLAIILTKTRSAYLAVLIETGYFSLFLLPKKKVVAFLAATIIFLIAAFSPFGQNIINKKINSPVISRFFSLENITSSFSGRKEAFAAGLKGAVKRPLFGYGPENFLIPYDEFYDGKLDRGKETLDNPDAFWESWFDKAHNIYIDLASTTGIFSLLSYLLIFFFLFLSAKKDKKLLPFPSAFAGYLTQGLLNFETLIPSIYLFVFIAIFIRYSGGENEKTYSYRQDGNNKEISLKKFSAIVFSATIIIFAAIYPTLSFSVKALSANYHLNSGESHCQYSLAYKRLGGRQAAKIEEELCFDNFSNALKENSPMLNRFIRIRYGYWAIKLNPDKKWITAALAEQKNNSKRGEFPYFTRNYIYAAVLANKLCKISNSQNYCQESAYDFKKAIELSPGRKSIKRTMEKLKIF